MCGIALVVAGSDKRTSEGIDGMVDIVAHRGPNGRGIVYFSEQGGSLVPSGHRSPWKIALGHRRLSILDLSDAGRQPMSLGDRLWISYNGEVYNYLEIRTELARRGATFTTGTDTEVILVAYREWGPACFERLRGMWGLVIVDTHTRQVVIARDRLGIKPLYTAKSEGWFAVASEIKQLRCLQWLQWKVRDEAVSEYLATGYEDPDQSFFTGIVPLAPGSYEVRDVDTLEESERGRFWYPERVRTTIRDEREAADRFREVFGEAVRVHLRSDVPVGCALSGGLDSSSIAAIARQHEQGATRIAAFSAVFPGDPADETPFIDLMVGHLGITCHRVMPDAEGLLNEIDEFLWHHDEPVGSLSQFAAYCVARLARGAGVPVVVNGQGGDEVFSGYWQSYFAYLFSRPLVPRVPELARHFLRCLAPGGNDHLARQLPVMYRRFRHRRSASAAGRAKLDAVLRMSDQERRVHEIRYMYLPRLLRWDDRNFMAHSIEGRYPFLDHKVIELALSMDVSVLYRSGWTKYPLRRAMNSLLPAGVCWRKSKLGFVTPQNTWLKTTLKDRIGSFLAGDSPVWSRVSRDTVRRLAAENAGLGSYQEEASQALIRCFMVDRWMKVVGLS